MKKIAFFILITALLFPLTSIAVYEVNDEGSTYERLPDGTSILNPVSIEVVLTGLGVDYQACVDNQAYWTFYISNNANELYRADIVAISQLTLSHIFNFPIGYKPEFVRVQCVDPTFTNFGVGFNWNTACAGFAEVSPLCDDSPIFEILTAGGEHLFSLPENMATSVFGFSQETMESLWQVSYILLGLALASGIILFVIDIFENRSKK